MSDVANAIPADDFDGKPGLAGSIEELTPSTDLSVESRGDDDFEALREDMEALIETHGAADELTYGPGVTDAEYEELDPSESPGNASHSVVVDGQSADVTIEELKAGYQRQADYTRKTQSLAEERRTLQAERQQYQSLMSALANNLDAASDTPPDEALFQSDPDGYIAARQAWQQRAALRETLATEQARVDAAVAAETAWAEHQHQLSEDANLAAAVPEWHDPRARDQGKADLVDYLRSQYGASENDIGAFTDHRLVVLALKAKKYDDLQTQKGLALKKIRNAPRVQKPGTARTAQEIDQAYVQGLRDRFYRSGSMEDAAELMKYIAD